MKDYNYTEIGMLFGAAIGGIFSAVGFSVSKNPLFFLIAVVGIFSGVILGKNFDRSTSCERKNKEEAKK